MGRTLKEYLREHTLGAKDYDPKDRQDFRDIREFYDLIPGDKLPKRDVLTLTKRSGVGREIPQPSGYFRSGARGLLEATRTKLDEVATKYQKLQAPRGRSKALK